MTLLTYNNCCDFVDSILTNTNKPYKVSTKLVRGFRYIQLIIDNQVWTIGTVETANAVLKQVI